MQNGWKAVVTVSVTLVSAAADTLIPVSWVKPILWIGTPILILSLWQVYKWPFIARGYSYLRRKLSFYYLFTEILITRRKIIHLAHYGAQTKRIVKATTLFDLEIEIEQLKHQVAGMIKKPKSRIVK